MKEWIISEREEGQRLDRFVGKLLPEATKGFLYKMLRKKNITLNGKRAEGDERLSAGDAVRLFFSEETFALFAGSGKAAAALDEKIPEIPPERILYADYDILVVDKPAGLLSQKARPEDVSLAEMAAKTALSRGLIVEEDLRTVRPGVCNRLDRNTTGIVVAGISAKGLRETGDLLRERSTKKTYLALVAGRARFGAHLTGYLVKDEAANTVRVLDAPEEGAARIETAFEVLAAGEQASLLQVDLITGKSHQIRAHLAHAGLPVLGDVKYGSAAANARARADWGVSRQMLHAWKMNLPQGDFTAPIPQDMRRAIEGAGFAVPKA
ncbi:MAG: RluA family pseudouridine synthase [Lachnospiraceae bacterium]|nr:RluA family pseudouridine synthase [Lachnospiraceae bacterium]